MLFEMFFPLLLVSSSVQDFFNTLIFGSGAWLYLILFLAILFLVSAKVYWFAIISTVACLFQMIAYINYANANGWTNSFIYQVIILGVSMSLFIYIFADEVSK